MIEDQVNHRVYKRVDKVQSTYTQEQKLSALAVYAETLNTTEASRVTGIPRTTIRVWVEDEDSIAILDDIRHAIRTTCAYKYAQIALKSANEIMERLENGDEVILSNGEYARKKVSARDLITISAMAADRHALCTGTSAVQGKANSALLGVMDKLLAAMQSATEQSKGALPTQDNPPGNA